MNVTIITEGGRNIGFGHIARCFALYQTFKEKGMAPKFVINGDDSIKSFLEGEKCRIFNWLKERNKLLEIIKNTEIVIIDSYLADISFYNIISDSVKIPVFIDDTKRLDYPKGIVINGSIYAEEIAYPKNKEIVYLLGIKYMPLRKEFWKVPEKHINKNINSIMISFGGNDRGNMTPRILRFLNGKYPGFIKNVVIGKGFNNIQEIENLRDGETKLIYYPDAKAMKATMLESDIALSAGGQTLYELARVGVPTVAIAVANNQLNNIRGWQKKGFIEYAGWWSSNDIFSKLQMLIRNMINISVRKKNYWRVRNFIDGNGSFKIINYLLNKNEK